MANDHYLYREVLVSSPWAVSRPHRVSIFCFLLIVASDDQSVSLSAGLKVAKQKDFSQILIAVIS